MQRDRVAVGWRWGVAQAGVGLAWARRRLRWTRLLALSVSLTVSPQNQQQSTSDAALQQKIQNYLQQSQAEHNAAVQIKQNTNGWLTGAPLAAEQADMAASASDLQKAQLLQLQLQQQETGVPTQAQYKTGNNGQQQITNSHPWNCGPDVRSPH